MATFEVGDIVTADSLNALFDKPMVRLVQQSVQAIANDTDVAITFGTGSTDYDTHSFHSESSNTSRITPSVPGIYTLQGTVFMASSSAVDLFNAAIAKNGSVQDGFFRVKPNAVAGTFSAQVEVTLEANGSTDYFQLIGRQISGGSLNTFVGGEYVSTFTCKYERSLP